MNVSCGYFFVWHRYPQLRYPSGLKQACTRNIYHIMPRWPLAASRRIRIAPRRYRAPRQGPGELPWEGGMWRAPTAMEPAAGIPGGSGDPGSMLVHGARHDARTCPARARSRACCLRARAQAARIPQRGSALRTRARAQHPPASQQPRRMQHPAYRNEGRHGRVRGWAYYYQYKRLTNAICISCEWVDRSFIF